MSEPKIYCGRGKTMQGPYGEFYKLNICLDDIPARHLTVGKNGKHYVNLAVSNLKQADDWGNNLTITVDTWKPNKQEPRQQPKRTTPEQGYANPEDFESSEIPF